MPLAGLGTWQYNSSVAKAAVLSALKLGYTHIDTALGYDNQDGVGEAIAASGVAARRAFRHVEDPGRPGVPRGGARSRRRSTSSSRATTARTST